MSVKVGVWTLVAMVGIFFLVWLKREHNAAVRRSLAAEKAQQEQEEIQHEYELAKKFEDGQRYRDTLDAPKVYADPDVDRMIREQANETTTALDRAASAEPSEEDRWREQGLTPEQINRIKQRKAAEAKQGGNP